MDAVALHENVLGHFRIPFTGKVTKVYTCIQQLLICRSCHFSVLLKSLTFTELEFPTCFAASWFFTLYHTVIARHQSFCTQCRLHLWAWRNQRFGYLEANSFRPPFFSSSSSVAPYIIASCRT